jgi:hypothetical protein
MTASLNTLLPKASETLLMVFSPPIPFPIPYIVFSYPFQPPMTQLAPEYRLLLATSAHFVLLPYKKRQRHSGISAAPLPFEIICG